MSGIDHNLHINSVDCLVHTKNIGMETVTNVCTGVVTNIPWGTVDWINNIMMGGLILFLVLLTLTMIIFTIILFRGDA